MPTRRDTLARLAAVSVLFPSIVCAQNAWKQWIGPKFGTRIEYPSDRFEMLPEPDAHDGRTFSAADGAQIAAYGGFTNVQDFESLVASTRAGQDHAGTTYRRGGSTWAVVSGYREIDGRRSVFYERYVLDPGGEVYHAVVITYPADLKKTYDSLVRRIARPLDASRYSQGAK